MKTGVVKWFSDTKGYGFIVGEDNKDIFVHYSAIQIEGYKSLIEGESVEYEDQNGPRGQQATQVFRKEKTY